MLLRATLFDIIESIQKIIISLDSFLVTRQKMLGSNFSARNIFFEDKQVKAHFPTKESDLKFCPSIPGSTCILDLHSNRFRNNTEFHFRTFNMLPSLDDINQ